MKKISYLTPIFILFGIASTKAFPASSQLNSLTNDELKAAKTLVLEMKKNERGPYSRLRWFCNDGTVLPPTAYACKDHGGGHQHAEYSDKRKILSNLGFHVGTIFTAFYITENADTSSKQSRLKELPLEKFMIDVDNGWVLQKARHYRGRIQLEDEIEAGRNLLLDLFSDKNWVRQNYLLARELVRAVPHHQGKDLTRSIRRSSTELADVAKDFESIRVEIHTQPSAKTSVSIKNWLERQNNPELIEQGRKLLDEIEELYSDAGRLERMQSLSKSLSKYQDVRTPLEFINQEPENNDKKINVYSLFLLASRELIENSDDANKILLLFDLQIEVEAKINALMANRLNGNQQSRKTYLSILSDLISATYGIGLLYQKEYSALNDNLKKLLSEDNIDIQTYQDKTRYLSYLASWTYDNVKYEFSGPLQRYTLLDSRAAMFVDDLLRGSPVFYTSVILQLLAQDVANNAGIVRHFFGQPESGLFGLNPGMAVGTLRILSDKDLARDISVSRDDIVVVPQTVAELKPVAGILTQGEGNLLSHVQLLARNFGIPNVAVSHDLVDKLGKMNDRKVMLLVGTDGTVFLDSYESIPDTFINQYLTNSSSELSEKLQVPTPDLTVNSPITITDLDKSLSGKLVGPKAANLGELYRLFPGKVSPAIALPFGIFYEHVNQGSDSIRKKLVTIYEQSRANMINESELNNELAILRNRIRELSVNDKLRDTLSDLMADLFGSAGSYGVFIRSDTNVEDLPGFTGAGLSETLPNIVGFDNQMDAIPTVWSSVLSERALLWRSRLLEKPEEVYASVLLMKSVNSEKSGVMITRNLWSKKEGLTVATAWGVGGAVGGESAETLVLHPDGSETLLTLAKSPYKRQIQQEGGIGWVDAQSGSVLKESEKRQLVELAKEINEKYAPAYDTEGRKMPWDIEYGFIDGNLTLFQIRPLVEKGQVKANRAVQALVKPVGSQAGSINLNQVAGDAR